MRWLCEAAAAQMAEGGVGLIEGVQVIYTGCGL